MKNNRIGSRPRPEKLNEGTRIVTIQPNLVEECAIYMILRLESLLNDAKRKNINFNEEENVFIEKSLNKYNDMLNMPESLMASESAQNSIIGSKAFTVTTAVRLVRIDEMAEKYNLELVRNNIPAQLLTAMEKADELKGKKTTKSSPSNEKQL